MTTTERKNEVLQIHTDHLGTPRAVTNAKNEKLWQWEGDAFGDVQPQVEHVKMPLRFAGQYADEEVGLFYNYFRFYNPETGRYIENDPIDLQGGLNRYGYVGGNPLHYVDPTGEFAIPFPVIVNTVANIAVQATRIILSSMIKDVVKENDDTKAEDDKQQCETCATKYPMYKTCSSLRKYGFRYNSKQTAMKMSGIIGSAPGKKTNWNTFCGEHGTHTNYRPTGKTQHSRHASFAGTITSCECCEDTSVGAKITKIFKAN